MTSPAVRPSARPRLSLYARLWRDVPRGLGFLLPTLFIVLAGLVAEWTLVSTGLGLLAIVVGVPVFVSALYVARGFGGFELLRLRATRRPPITPPVWVRDTTDRTGFARFFTPLTDGHYWLHLLHTLVVGPVVGIVTWAVTVAWLGADIWGIVSWIQGILRVPGDDPIDRISDASLAFLVSVATTAALPFVVRGMVMVHWWIGRGMLGAFRSEALAGQVEQLTVSRSAAAAAEGSALRRLERDIHDGPQQRLVRLQMDLAAAERQLDRDPERTRELLAEAAAQSREALEELRALSRGFAPPLLLDRGLRPALAALADRSPVPVRFVDDLPAEVVLPVELERNLYFVAAEALTNVAKHADAAGAELRVSLTVDGEFDLAVSDDGRGGAVPVEGHGMAGLAERVRGVGGTLEVSSPPGGPTVVRARVPLPR